MYPWPWWVIMEVLLMSPDSGSRRVGAGEGEQAQSRCYPSGVLVVNVGPQEFDQTLSYV